MDIDEKMYKLLVLLSNEENMTNFQEYIDLANVRDYFMFLTLEIVEKGDKKLAERYVDKFEEWCNTDDKFIEGFFFTLSNILSLKFEIGKIEGNMIKKENWKESFKNTLRRIEWN